MPHQPTLSGSGEDSLYLWHHSSSYSSEVGSGASILAAQKSSQAPPSLTPHRCPEGDPTEVLVSDPRTKADPPFRASREQLSGPEHPDWRQLGEDPSTGRALPPSSFAGLRGDTGRRPPGGCQDAWLAASSSAHRSQWFRTLSPPDWRGAWGPWRRHRGGGGGRLPEKRTLRPCPHLRSQESGSAL